MASYLPQADGLLPLFILLVGVTAITNAVTCYNTTSYTRRLYPGPRSNSPPPSNYITKTTTTVVEESYPPPDRRASVTFHAIGKVDESPATPLSTRTFGTWNIAVGIVRLYAAYHITEPAWYQMQMITNIIGLLHFGSEAFVFKTTRPSGPWLAPVMVASVGLGWSIAQYGYYVK